MGISIAIAGGITMATALVILGVASTALNELGEENEASSVSFKNNDAISKTDIRITGIGASPGSNLLNFTIGNEGIEKVWNYEEFDFFVTYDADILGTKTRVTEQLTFNKTAYELSTANSIETSDFKIQRDCTTIPNGATTTTLTAGIDYNAPQGESFVRLVDTRLSGWGHTDNSNDDQGVDEFSVLISDASDLSNQIVFERVLGPGSVDTGICYEIIDYQGLPDSPNAIRVLDRNTVTYVTSSLTVSGSSILPFNPTGEDVVVFITGQMGNDTASSDFNNAQSIAEWDAVNDEPDFKRGQADGNLDQNPLSYAVVEFTGSNWKIQRHEHTVTVDGVQVDIDFGSAGLDDLGDSSKAFLHTQHTSSGDPLDEIGGEAWISAPDTLSIFAEGSGSSTRVIAMWIIENTQTQGTLLNAQHLRDEYVNTNDLIRTLNAPADFVEVGSLDSSSIWGENARSAGAGNRYPRGSVSLNLTDTNQVTLMRSDNAGGGGNQGQDQRIRFSLVEYPKLEHCVGGDSTLIAVDEWTLSCITYDYLYPGIVNPNESPQILSKLQYPIFTNGFLQITMSTDNGEVDSQIRTVV